MNTIIPRADSQRSIWPHRWGVKQLSAFAVLAAFSASVFAATPLPETTAPDQVAIERELSHKIVATVLMQLRNAARERKRTDLYRLLTRVRIAVPDRSVSSQFPNAYAFSDEKIGDWILVEERWLGQIAGFADLAALLALSEGGWGMNEYLIGFYKDYCGKFQQTFRQQSLSGPPVVHRFVIGDYLDRANTQNAALLLLYDKAGGLTFINMVAWTVLHELGHHVLEHTTRADTASKAERRQFELAADKWAFQEMQSLGYSLYPVEAYFLAREWSDWCFRGLDLLTPEEDNTHPDWSTRNTALFKNFSWRRASDQDTRLYFIPGVYPVYGAQYMTITIPDKSLKDRQAFLVQMDHLQLGIVEWNQDTATVYTREAAGGRLEYFFKNPLDMMVTIFQRRYDDQDRFVDTVELQGVQQDIVSLDFAEFRGTRFSSIRSQMQTDNLWRRILRGMGITEEKIRQTFAIRDQFLPERDVIMGRYMKGEQSFDDFAAELKAYAGRYEAALVAILGRQHYDEFTAAVKREKESIAPGGAGGIADWEKEIMRENFGR